MKPARYATLAVAWLRPNSLWPLVVVLPYGRYFLLVLDQAPPTDIYLAWLLATGAPGIWLGHCARDARVWPAAMLVPNYTRTLASFVVVGLCTALALSAVAAWLGDLAPWDCVTYGALAITLALLAGYHLRYVALVVLVLVGVSIRGAGGALVPAVAQPLAAPALATLLGAFLVAYFLYGIHRPPSGSPWRLTDKLRHLSPALGLQFRSVGIVPPPWRVVGTLGVAAIVVAAMSRYGPIGLHSLEWVVLAGALVLATFAGQSSSFPQGQLATATSLLLLGAGKTREAVARQIVWRAAGDSCLGAATFMAVTLAFGTEVHLYEIFVTLASCHLYLLGASGFKWLLSSRSSLLIAMPCVAFITWLGGKLLPMGLPAAIVAFVASALAAAYWGSKRIGGLDFAG